MLLPLRLVLCWMWAGEVEGRGRKETVSLGFDQLPVLTSVPRPQKEVLPLYTGQGKRPATVKDREPEAVFGREGIHDCRLSRTRCWVSAE